MECEKCKSTDLVVINKEKTLRIDWCTGEQYETTIFYIKCNNCGHEFEEEI